MPAADRGTLADNVAPKLMNNADIKTKYDALDTMWPNPSDAMNTGKKFESPAMYSIRAATKALMADTTPGAKYIIFITDGQEDFCDDALEICASDSTVGALQAAYAANIKTIVFGLQTTQFNLPAGVLQAFANAGAGETTVPGLASGLDTTAIFDQCQGVMPWKTDLTASGHPTTRGPTATVGTYGTTAGPTKPFQPSASDSTMLVTQLSQALAGVKSCTFDLKRRQRQGDQGRHVEADSGARAHPRHRGSAQRHQRLERRRRGDPTHVDLQRRCMHHVAHAEPARRSISSSRAAASSSSKPMTKTHSFACSGATALVFVLAWLHRRRETDADRPERRGRRHRAPRGTSGGGGTTGVGTGGVGNTGFDASFDISTADSKSDGVCAATMTAAEPLPLDLYVTGGPLEVDER